MHNFTKSDMENLIKVIATEWHYVVICIYYVYRELFIHINNVYHVIHVYA